MAQLSDVRAWCRAGQLPDSMAIYEALTDTSTKFTAVEGATWDFKDEWPFSLSNEYFGGICRLACAFANSAGGLIVFGVDNVKRTGGHNKVSPNVDKFMQAFRQLTGRDLQFSFRHYENGVHGNIDVLLIMPRSPGSPPLRFLRAVDKYPAGTLWVRTGHEVTTASPTNFPLLFCRADPTENVLERDGSILPSPATVKRFVGRVEVLDRLFAWLETSDEPRTYLHGKGGSGKTTIAYEFARLVKDFGDRLRIEHDQPEVVLF